MARSHPSQQTSTLCVLRPYQKLRGLGSSCRTLGWRHSMDVRGVHPSLPTYILPTYILPTQSLANLEQGRARESKGGQRTHRRRFANPYPLPGSKLWYGNPIWIVRRIPQESFSQQPFSLHNSFRIAIVLLLVKFLGGVSVAHTTQNSHMNTTIKIVTIALSR